jgi:hypothetical protein
MMDFLFFCPTIYQIDNTNAFDHVSEMNHKDDFDNMDQLNFFFTKDHKDIIDDTLNHMTSINLC